MDKTSKQDDMISKISQGINNHVNEVIDLELLFSDHEVKQETVVEEKKSLPMHLLITIGLLAVLVFLLIIWLLING